MKVSNEGFDCIGFGRDSTAYKARDTGAIWVFGKRRAGKMALIMNLNADERRVLR